MSHPELGRIAKALRGTEFEGRAWLVGGAVRDELLGRAVGNDIDIVVRGDASKAADILWQKKVASIAPVTYPRFGTAMVRVGHKQIEFATARKESYDDDSRKPTVEPATIEEDASRRDFTVNTLLRDLFSGELVDPLGTGERDLRNKVLRTPRDPVETFHDDPLRMLRAVRFRWQLGFAAAPGLYDAVRNEAERLKIISSERIRDELTIMLGLDDGHKCLADLMDLGLMHHIAPEFETGVGVEQGPYHYLDVWDHTLEVVRNTGSGDLTLRLAAWLHDVAKPQCRTVEGGRIKFLGHEQEGAKLAEAILRRLTFSLDECKDVALLVLHHMRFTGIEQFSDTAARRILRDLGEQTERLVQLGEADAAAHAENVKRPDFNEVRNVLQRVAEETPPERLQSPLSGDEIMELTGLSAGPKVGKVKHHLSEMVIEGALDPDDMASARTVALEFVRDSASKERDTAYD
ncbi:MAG: HD domain-containing protein [Armatimonadetes bacterium]|nr:HD domain-containing protein [Armatimonadota bacterium]